MFRFELSIIMDKLHVSAFLSMQFHFIFASWAASNWFSNWELAWQFWYCDFLSSSHIFCPFGIVQLVAWEISIFCPTNSTFLTQWHGITLILLLCPHC